MKTLDEVIKGFECCENTDCGNCPYKILFNDDSHVPCDQFSKDEDALYYLKEYREKQYELSAMFDEYQAKVAEDPNEPLDWEELKQMEGKPVWVEPCKEWMLITEIETEPHIWLLSLDGMDYDMSLHEWQAYRKER